MSNPQLMIFELLIAKSEGRSTLQLFTAHPTPLEEKNLGRLFGIIEIDSSDSVTTDIIQIVLEHIETAYYQSPSFEIEKAFEHALQKTNEKIHSLVGEIGQEWLAGLHCVIAVQKDEKLIFTSLGRIIAFLIKGDTFVDILETTKTQREPIDPEKVFSNTIAGELQQQTTLVFGTESLLDYLSKEKIKRIVADHEPQEAVNTLRELLQEDTANTNFAALIATIQDQPENTEFITSSVGNSSLTDDSMTTLVTKEQETEDLLSSSLWPNMKKELRRGVEGKVNAQTPLYRRVLLSAGVLLNRGARLLWKSSVSASKKLMSLLSSFFTKKRKQGDTSSPLRNAHSPYRPPRSIGQKISGIFVAILKWFQSLTLMQKVFFIVALTVLVIFAQSVILQGEEQLTEQQEETYTKQIADIDVKINEGKAAILYDAESARTLFIEARELLKQIPEDSDMYKERGAQLTQVIQEELKKVNNVVVVEQPKTVLDYARIHPEIQVDQVVLLGASMYAFDRYNGSVYRGNLEDQSTSVTISNANEIDHISRATKASPGTAIALRAQQVGIFNPIEESFSPLDLSFPHTSYEFVDLSIFGIRLYLLDKTNNQIVRHQKTGENFAEGTDWITQEVDLSKATSFAIDGEIYVLNTDGSVIRFAAGAKDDSFHLAEIDAALTNPKKIYTDENTQNLYILDPAEKRVVVFSKEGKLVAQYTSPAFSDLRDMVVDEPNNHLYLLNGSTLYEVSLQETKKE